MFNLNFLIMGLLHSENSVPIVPCPELFPFEFRESFSVVKEDEIFDKDGNFIQKLKRNVVETRTLSRDVLEHRGISADMFKIDNQLSAGVALSPVPSNFLTPSLDERSRMEDSIMDGMKQVEEESASTQNSETINFKDYESKN